MPETDIRKLDRVFAYDIYPDGTAAIVNEQWPELAPPAGAAYRWVHLDRTSTGLDEWSREMLPAMSAQALLEDHTRPRCLETQGGVILILRGLNMNPGAPPEDMVSLRMWATPQALVSVRLRRVFAVQDMREAIESGAPPPTISFLLAALAERLTSRITNYVHTIEEQLDEMDEDVFGDNDGAPVQLNPLRLNVIRLNRYFHPQQEAFYDLLEANSILHDDDRPRMVETANRMTRTVEMLNSVQERLRVMRDHLDTRQANRMTRNSYILSIIAGIFLPLGFLTGLLGINVGGIPGSDDPFAFVIVCLLMLATGAGIAILFRWLKWF